MVDEQPWTDFAEANHRNQSTDRAIQCDAKAARHEQDTEPSGVFPGIQERPHRRNGTRTDGSGRCAASGTRVAEDAENVGPAKNQERGDRAQTIGQAESNRPRWFEGNRGDTRFERAMLVGCSYALMGLPVRGRAGL